MGNQNQVGGYSVSIGVTPTISTSAYTTNFQLGGIQTLTSACQYNGATSNLKSLIVIDNDNQAASISIFFFNQLPTIISTDHNGFAVSTSELSGKCVGVARVSSSNYDTTTSSAVATVFTPSCSLAMRSLTDGGHLYAVAKVTSTPTYSSTSSLKFVYLFAQDL